MLLLLVASLLGNRLAERAQSAAGLRSVRQLSRTATDDCSGFVRTIYAREGVHLTSVPPRPGENGATWLHRVARARQALRKVPRPGDLVFFRNTYRPGLSHVGIVDSVQGHKVTFVHRTRGGIVRSRLDLRHPHARRSNDVLRRPPRRALTGELLAGFAAPDPLTD
jgi:cell wall-associated NlpC family hydrolase